MRDRSMRSGTKLAQEIQLTDWSTAREQGKPVFVIHAITGAIYFTFHNRNPLSILKITDQSKFFNLRFLSRKNEQKKFVLTSKNFFRNLNPIRRFRVARKAV